MRSIRNNLIRLTRDKRKITDAKAAEIRRKHEAGETQRALAAEFKLARSTISGIVCRYSWRGVD